MPKIKDIFKYYIPKKCIDLLDFEMIEACAQCSKRNTCSLLVDYEIEREYEKEHWSISRNTVD